MFFDFLTKIFGSKNEREIKRLMPIVEQINALEPQMQAMSDEELRRQTVRFEERFQRGETLDEILPEAFATVREASARTLNMRHFDVQLIGGIVLHQGKISEMKTGEGKTLVSTLPAYLNAITGKGVHIVTVNDYLARRDTEWMGQIYRFLGMTVGTILHGLTDEERQTAYNADIIYGTNNEFGFDYLRDNMKYDISELVQRDLHYAIVDEVDSILVDEARTPLIISGQAEKSTDLYYHVNTIIPNLRRDTDYTIDEKARSVVLTEDGVAKAEKALKIENLYDPKHIEHLHHVNQALKAHTLFKRDVDYIVKDGEVIIVDEFTGRLMPGRRYSEGLHQALEAKEHVTIENENQTLATITFQNYFRMYEKLAGMTGTADTEAAEFKKIYNLDVVVIPTNKPMIRKDHADVIYKTKREKYEAVLDEIGELHKKGQPVLVGTISIDVSEDLSKKLTRRGIPHSVLNAKNHEKEAEIIAQAGRKNAVTIATNMAGRGTDIVLGGGYEGIARIEAQKREIGRYDEHGRMTKEYSDLIAEMKAQTAAEHDEVVRLGGLHILGTERHESRRIDNQLRGRSGRQGDPGSSRFYLALEDDLLRIFGGERISGIMDRLGLEEGEPIEHTLISKAIENAQTKVEAHNFDIRKHLLEYDDVMNQQREVIYAQRKESLGEENIRPMIEEIIWEKSEEIALALADDKAPVSEWDFKGFEEAVFKQFNFRMKPDPESVRHLNGEALTQMLYDAAIEAYNKKEAEIGEDMRRLERMVMLQTVDNFWKDHLLNMDHLKEGIGLRGYAQQNPLLVYKKEGFEMFADMMGAIKEQVLTILYRIEIAKPENIEDYRQHRQQQKLLYSGAGDSEVKRQPVRKDKKVGRNDPCPCGSGKKYKKCCGA